MNTMHKREILSNTEAEKNVFFENWTPENLPEIAEMRRQNMWTSVHEFALEPNMRMLLNDIAGKQYNKSEIARMLKNYWIFRAIYVLTQYSNYMHPLKKNERINLLSDKGMRLLNQLKSGITLSDDLIKSSCHKDSLDLDLFADLHFNTYDFADQQYKFLSPVSGCPYHCVYCAENSGRSIYSMPYPVYLKILKSYGATDEQDATHIGPHNDSEAPMYHDTTLHADLGDISHTASKWQSKISILTKGISLGGLMDLAYSKRFYSRNKPSITKVNISLLSGDDIERNINLAFNVKKIATLYGGQHRLSAKIFASPENFIKYADKIKSIKGAEGTLFWAGLEPVGRAVNVKEAYIRLTDDEIADVMQRAGFKMGDVETNMHQGFAHSRYLTSDGHMQMDAFGNVYMKAMSDNALSSKILYNIYNINNTRIK